MKNKIVAALLVVALFIPTIVAVVNYISLQGGEVSAVNVEYIDFTDPNGVKNSFTRDGSDEEKEMLDFFINVKANSDEIAEPPSTVNDKLLCNMVAYTTSGGENAFKFYFTSNKEDCYFVDGNGDTYNIDADYALKFLNSKYAGFVFENGSAPTLDLTGSGTVIPDTSTWNFIGADGKFIAGATKTKNEVETVELEGGFNMTFSSEPDLFKVKVVNKEDGIVLFDDEYANIAGLTIESNMTVSVEANAKWYQEDTRNYYGEQTYKFEATLSAPAEFFAGAVDITAGEFICITAVNVNTPENISFTSEPAIGFTPKFYANGDYAYALIPFSSDLAGGTYNLSFTYGSTSQNVAINVSERTYTDKSLAFSTAIINIIGTEEVKASSEEVIAEALASGSETKYFEGGFKTPFGDNSILCGYGRLVTAKNSEGADSGISYKSTGVEYFAAPDTNVTAGYAGKVVFAGRTDYHGNIVIVEHGYGLKTVYSHMTEVKVAEGDIIDVGTVVGTTGNSGFAPQNDATGGYGVLVEMMINNVPVLPYSYWSTGEYNGVPIYDPAAN